MSDQSAEGLRNLALDATAALLNEAGQSERPDDVAELLRGAMNASAVALNCARIQQTDRNGSRR